MAAANPWVPETSPTAAGLLLAECLSSGLVTQEILDSCKNPAPFFVNFSRIKQIKDMQAEIREKTLELDLLTLEKDTADVVHPFFLAQKCETLQSMNQHLETVLKEKRALRHRLMKPACQENLPIEAIYHRYVVQLLELAVTFIEKLEAHIEAIRNIPCLDSSVKNMDRALTKMSVLEGETEELIENILKWKEQQKEISSSINKIFSGDLFRKSMRL
ncbi:HAUS augmin-like complex subunit 2 [Phascolarctos cinereus]|uniref:HAUS augmin-like complex subunit 2 n=1 Tax=Phascolarctos cinereus TaxID=38626 RepID=A0A6P5M9K8_PHACI|nr:HAUS augmin-like complex subunit 2 [Phascolarctos cinereus]